MPRFIIITIAALALAASAQAQAGNPSLCARDGWAQAQSQSGQAFASLKDCAKARDVFQPTVSIAPAHVVAGEQFWLTASGFHPNATSTVLFAITGEPVYGTYTPFYPIAADGSFTIPFAFPQCRQQDTGGDVPVDLTLTFVDSYGVHASARLALC